MTGSMAVAEAQVALVPSGATNAPSLIAYTQLQLQLVALPGVKVRGAVSPPRVSPFRAPGPASR